MKCKILHESAGRMRVHLNCRRMTLHQADVLEYYLRNVDGVREVSVFDRTQDAVIVYRADRAALVHALAAFSFDKAETMDLVPDHTTRKLNREFEDKLSWTVIRRVISKLFFPLPVTTALAIYHSIKYIREGLSALLHGKLSVAVLDATAVTVSMVRGDFSTASSVMFMLRLGEILEDWTHKKSVADLAGAMSLNVDHVWLKTGETETLVPIGDIQAGDCVVVRTGNLIPLDGKVVSGEAMVNQASMTGESMPVPKREGSYVYAGTVAEEGECVVRVEKALGGGRYDRIVRMIEESEKLKSTAEDKASRLADKLVPYTLGGTILTYLITRNVTKMLAVLMVDFSCALKLSMPIAVLSAMRESSSHHISVKGGRFLEAVAQANTIVFDKTGTLTYATPKVAQIITFGGNEESEMLRLAACLEEHYPHSIANAVVAEAKDRGLTHEEYHSQVQYVVAHGISSMVDEKTVLIGSAHFVFEDEGCRVPEGEEDKFESLPPEYSHLYLCIAGELAAVICIHDPLRKEAKAAVRALHELGIDKVVMMRQPQDCRSRRRRGRRRRCLRRSAARGQGCVRPQRKGRGPQGHHDRRRRERLPRPVRGRRGHRHFDRRRHRARDRGHHHLVRGSVRARHAALSQSGAHGPHPPQLPLHRELQLLAHRAWRAWHPAADNLGAAAQHVHARHWPQEHDEPPARKRAEQR